MRSNPPLEKRWTALTATGEQVEGTDPGPKHTDPRNTDGDGPRAETREAGRRGEVVYSAPGTPQKLQPVRGPVSSSGPEHSGGTSRSHHACGGGDHRQDQLYKSDAGSSSAPASSSAAGCNNGRAWRTVPESPSSFSLVTGLEGRGTEDTTTRHQKRQTRMETPAPSTPPRTTLDANVNKKARISEDVTPVSPPGSSPSTRLAQTTAKAFSLGGHVIYDFDQDCFSETSHDVSDFLEFQDRVLESLWSEEIRVSTLTRVCMMRARRCHVSCLQKQRQQPSTSRARHLSMPLHHVSAVPRDGAVGVSYLLLDSGACASSVRKHVFQWCC